MRAHLKYVYKGNVRLRLVGAVHELSAARAHQHRGWYIDGCECDKLQGVVYQLPSRKGKERYVAGVEYSYEPEAAIIDTSRVYESKDGRVLWDADGLAERIAAEDREAWEADQAEIQAAEAKAEKTYWEGVMYGTAA